MEKAKKAERPVFIIKHIEALGLCEHCGALLSVEDMPGDAMNARWFCPKCNEEIGHKTFGYEMEMVENEKGDKESKFKKTQWVGSNGQWVNEKPKRDFILGNWEVFILPPRIMDINRY